MHFFMWNQNSSHELSSHSQFFPSGLWNYNHHQNQAKTAQFLDILVQYYLSSRHWFLTFQCKPDGIYCNECQRCSIKLPFQTFSKLRQLWLHWWHLSDDLKIYFCSGPQELQDWDAANLIRIWRVTWGFLCHIIRTAQAATGNVKWGLKGSLSLDSLPHSKLILNCRTENCPNVLQPTQLWTLQR